MAETEDEVDALHPRLSTQLIGQESAEQRLLKAYLSGKMHHAWILGGARGIGKATLAYKFATFVLRYPDPAAFDDRPANLDVDPDDPVARRIVSQGHADLLAITPAWDHRNKRYKTEIGATEARQASNFFARTAGEGGWRVCIVDPAGSMNVTAANALLKILEEPPSRALFLLVADTPGRLLQTIRSRCLRLDLKPLDDSNVSDVLRTLVARDAGLDLSGASSIVPYAGGSPGRAARILKEGGFKIFETFLAIAEKLPTLDRKMSLRLAQQLAARNAALEFLQFCDLLLSWLTQHAGNAARGSTQPPFVQNPASWASAYDEINRSLRRTNALNLDKQNAILNVLNILAGAAATPPASGGFAQAG